VICSSNGAQRPLGWDGPLEWGWWNGEVSDDELLGKDILTSRHWRAGTAALAEARPPPWELKPDMAMPTTRTARHFPTRWAQQCRLLLKGAKKVPRGTLFFIGQNGQLYMRTAPISGRRKFMFGSN